MVGYSNGWGSTIDELSTTLRGRFDEHRNKAHEESKVQGRHERLDDAVADMYIEREIFLNMRLSLER